MEIIRRGLILPEEEAVANKLRGFPDKWWCIGGDSNRFSFKKGEGTQIDFIVIAPKGIFFIDAKNINTIEQGQGNIIQFFNSEGKQVRKNIKRENPVDEIIEDRYIAKDWLRNKGIPEFMTNDRKDLKIFMHGVVVLSNEENINYKNCSLESISYYNHKYPTLIPLSRLTNEFIENMNLPSNCKELTNEEMWALFKIFYSPDLSITQILNEIKKDEDRLYEEKRIFIEKMRLLETENVNLNIKTKELEGTRNNLIAVNQELNDSIKNNNITISDKNNEIDNLKSNQNSLEQTIEQLQVLKDKELEASDYLTKLTELNKKYSTLENHHNKLKLKFVKGRSSLGSKSSFHYKIASIVLFLLLMSSIAYFLIYYSKDNTFHHTNTDKVFTIIENTYPVIKELYQNQKYNELIKFWEKNINSNEIDIKRAYNQYEPLLFFLAKAYQENKKNPKNRNLQKARKYYDTFIEITKNPKWLIEAYYYKSITFIEQKVQLDVAISDLNKAMEINKIYFADDKIQSMRLLLNLGFSYRLIDKDETESMKTHYQKVLKVHDFSLKAIDYYKKGRDIASKLNDRLRQAEFLSRIGEIYLSKKEFLKANEQFSQQVLLLDSFDEKDLSTKDLKIEVLENRMLAYNDVGASYSFLKRYDKAEEYYKKAIDMTQSNKIIDESIRKRYEAEFSRNLGVMYTSTKKFNKALPVLENAYNIAKDLKFKDIENYQKHYDDVKKYAKLN